MAVPSVRDWSTGDKITANRLDEISTALSWLLDPPTVNAYRNAALNAADNTQTLVSLDSEDYDTASFHSTSTNPSRLNIPYDGRYRIIAWVGFDANSSGDRGIQVRKNAAGSSAGGTYLLDKVERAPSSSRNSRIGLTLETGLVAGDYIEMFALQTSGGTLAFDVGARKLCMSATWVGQAT